MEFKHVITLMESVEPFKLIVKWLENAICGMEIVTSYIVMGISGLHG